MTGAGERKRGPERLPGRRKPASVETIIGWRDKVIKARFLDVLKEDGISPEHAGQLIREALRRGESDWNKDLPDVTKADLRQIKIRR